MILLKASFSIDPANRPSVITALRDLRAAALKVPGCRGFEILEEPHERDILTVVEEWADDEALQVHDGSEAVAAFWRETGQLMVQQGPTRRMDVNPGGQTLIGMPVVEEQPE